MDAREVMDAMTVRFIDGNLDALAGLYAPDAVAVTPDSGEIHGRDAIMTYFRQFVDAFPDASFESQAKYAYGDTAIDEGYFVGTNTGPLVMPTGDVPATGRSIRLRSCDIATVEDGMIVNHHFYYDQLEFLTQLGLLPEMAA